MLAHRPRPNPLNNPPRNYHGHLSGVYCMALHPTLDILFTGGRDASCR